MLFSQSAIIRFKSRNPFDKVNQFPETIIAPMRSWELSRFYSVRMTTDLAKKS